MDKFDELYLRANRIENAVGREDTEQILKKLKKGLTARMTLEKILKNLEKRSCLLKDSKRFTELYSSLTVKERMLCPDLVETAATALLIAEFNSRNRSESAKKAKNLLDGRESLLKILVSEQTPAGAVQIGRKKTDWQEEIEEWLDKTGIPEPNGSMADFRKRLYKVLQPLFEADHSLLEAIQEDPEGFDFFTIGLMMKEKIK